MIYWHCISAPVLLVNVLLFGSFVKGLCFGIWSDETAAKTSTTHKRNNIKTTVKMFFTLGIPYVCDLIAWSLLWAYGRTSFKVFAITGVLKVINASQGFIMFCVIYLDGSKVRSVYQKTMSYTTRSTHLSVLRRQSDVVVKYSNDTKTVRIESRKDIEIENQVCNVNSTKVESSEQKSELQNETLI